MATAHTACMSWWPRSLSVQSSRSVMSDSLKPRGLQHARLPCPSPSPRAFSNCMLEEFNVQQSMGLQRFGHDRRLTHTHTHTQTHHTHACTHARTHTRMRTHSHTTHAHTDTHTTHTRAHTHCSVWEPAPGGSFLFVSEPVGPGLVLQGLRLHLPGQGLQVQSLQEDAQSGVSQLL